MKTSLLASLRRAVGGVFPSAEVQERRKFLQYKAKAEVGDAEAQYNLGGCYDAGRVVEKDHVEAVKWWRKAAEQNYPFAQSSVSFCYANGRGVPKDYVEAYAWSSLTSCAWPAEAVAKNCDVLADAMSPQQVADGKKRADELRLEIEAKRKSART